MSGAFFAFNNLFNRKNRTNTTLPIVENNPNGSNQTTHPAGQRRKSLRGTCRAVWAFLGTRNGKFKLNKYFVNKKGAENAAQDANGKNVATITKNDATGGRLLTAKPADDRKSKMNHLSVDDEFLESQRKPAPSVSAPMNGEEASLTQIVIAQIEHDYKERSLQKEIDWESKSHLSQPANATVHDSLDNHHEDRARGKGTAVTPESIVKTVKTAIDRAEAASPAVVSMAKLQNTEGDIKGKLSVPLGLVEAGQEASEDPIYDVPPSKSLVNLSSTANDDEEISLQRQHRIQVNSEHGYFHTSSPNIFLSVQEEDCIYDTPSTRSLAI